MISPFELLRCFVSHPSNSSISSKWNKYYIHWLINMTSFKNRYIGNRHTGTGIRITKTKLFLTKLTYSNWLMINISHLSITKKSNCIEWIIETFNPIALLLLHSEFIYYIYLFSVSFLMLAIWWTHICYHLFS